MAPPVFLHANLPGRLTRMVGRDEDVLKLSTQLAASRFVTVVGAGGIGKTTVAVAVAHQTQKTFNGAALFVDLGMLSDPGLVVPAISSMLGVSVGSEDPTLGLIAHLRDKRVLLVLDTCEHLIDAVAVLASHIFRDAPDIHILATSREALQVEGEYVYKLDSLDCPPEDEELTVEASRSFPATRLFVERALASGAQLKLTDREVSVVASICRRLDGVPLAIELAARRVEAYGLEQTAALLDQRLTLQWQGPRGALPRQRTLQATIDWSFGLLSDMERTVLRRLAVFVGHFTLDAALAVATSVTVDQANVLGAIESLVAKSMVATRPIGAMMRYRLLDTTRAYALNANWIRPKPSNSPRATRLTIGHGCSRPALNGRLIQTASSVRLTLPVLIMPEPRWNGALAPTATSVLASDLPPQRCLCSSRCRFCRRRSAGLSAQSRQSTRVRAAGSKRCVSRPCWVSR